MLLSFPSSARFLPLLLGLLVTPLLAPAPAAQAQDGNVIDEIVAVVDGKIILRSDVDGYVLGLTQQQGMTYSDQLWMDALNQLVDQEVLTIHARRDTTIQITDDQVDQALDQRIRQLTSQVGSESRLEEIYGKSIVQIKADLRKDFRDRLLAEQIRGRKMNNVRITPTEVERWFEQFPTDSLPTLPTTVRVAHIVRYPKASDQARQEALEIITSIRDSVVTGTTSLEEMARRFSDDTGSASDGGRISDIQLNELVPEFAAIASRLPIGEVSEPFETTFGFHILRVNERRGDEVDFNHVLIRVDESQADPTEAIEYLSAVRDSILTQEIPFELMARRNSEEEASAEVGGRVLDPQTRERDLFLSALGPSWQSTLDTMEVGEISKPAEAELLDGSRAYHIVKLQKWAPEHRVSLEQDYQFIKERALQDKQARVLREWIDRLREDVYIELRGKARRLSSSLAQAPPSQS
ncbi:MAG: peptidylprolyl isomerase [Bacteroidetes bacterium]|jgi:peptidyl-prolyl cis-trans isomerase SurA|nr:peptidylprolyl isomerase [Bacteroidota bacterium]